MSRHHQIVILIIAAALTAVIAVSPWLATAIAQAQNANNLPVPAGLKAEAAGPAVLLTWSATDSDDVTHYRVERARGGNTFALLTPNTGTASPAFRDATSAPGITYRYRVAAASPSGHGNFSNEVTITAPSEQADQGHVDLGDITDTPGLNPIPSKTSTQQYRFQLTQTRDVIFLLRHHDPKTPTKELFSQEFEHGEFYLTFTLKNFSGYQLHYAASPPPGHQDTQPSPEPTLPPVATPAPSPAPSPTPEPTITPVPDPTPTAAPTNANTVDLGDITDKTGFIPTVLLQPPTNSTSQTTATSPY